MSLSVNDVIHWFRDLPWSNDVDVEFLEKYRQQVWKRDQGGDVPSRGALAYYHREMFGAIVERFNTIGRLPGGTDQQFATETIQAFEIGLQRAIAAYRAAQPPGPEDQADPGDPPASGSKTFGNRWTSSGVDFIQDGRRRKYLGMTGFTLYQDFLDGRDRTDFLRFAYGAGCTHIRVFGMWGKNGTMFDPRNYGQRFYSRFPEFGRWVDSEGLGIHFVTVTDQVPGSGIEWPIDDLRNHQMSMQSLIAALTNGFEEDINEYDFNGKIVFTDTVPMGLLRTRSSWIDGDTWLSVGSLLGGTTEHTPRDPQASRKAKNLFETSRQGLAPPNKPAVPATNKWAIGGEPQRVELLSPSGVESYFSIALGMGSGACLHGDPQTFQRCIVPTDPAVLDRVQVFASVAKDPPGFEFHSGGQYTRGGLGDMVIEHVDRYNDNNDGNQEVDARGTRRSYGLYMGNRAIAMVDDPGSQWEPIGAHGWRVVRRHNTRFGLTVDLER